MKKIVIEITKKILPIILIGVLVSHIANKSVYMHTHKLDDGTLVTHSHPYDKSNDTKPYKSHHHSKAELFFLQQIEILFFTSFCFIGILNLVRTENLNIHFVVFYESKILFHKNGRAPPCFIQS